MTTIKTYFISPFKLKKAFKNALNGREISEFSDDVSAKLKIIEDNISSICRFRVAAYGQEYKVLFLVLKHLRKSIQNILKTDNIKEIKWYQLIPPTLEMSIVSLNLFNFLATSKHYLFQYKYRPFNFQFIRLEGSKHLLNSGVIENPIFNTIFKNWYLLFMETYKPKTQSSFNFDDYIQPCKYYWKVKTQHVEGDVISRIEKISELFDTGIKAINNGFEEFQSLKNSTETAKFLITDQQNFSSGSVLYRLQKTLEKLDNIERILKSFSSLLNPCDLSKERQFISEWILGMKTREIQPKTLIYKAIEK